MQCNAMENKMLSYRRETALHAGCVIVFAKSRRLELELGDNILLIL